MILSANDLVHYDPNRLIVLDTDASQYGLGAAMYHIMDDGSEHPVGFVSRTLHVAENNYSQLDKQGAAVIFSLKLLGKRFTIVTDHKPLLTSFGDLVPASAMWYVLSCLWDGAYKRTFAVNRKDKQVPDRVSPRIQRWAVIFRAYEYTMEYCLGEQHMNADCFSRLCLPTTESADTEDRNVMRN